MAGDDMINEFELFLFKSKILYDINWVPLDPRLGIFKGLKIRYPCKKYKYVKGLARGPLIGFPNT
jgi:hypothetical protein